MALANRVGAESVLTFTDGSFVTDPFGQCIAQVPFGEEDILYADLDLAQCRQAPARQLFLRHRHPEVYAGGAVRTPGT